MKSGGYLFVTIEQFVYHHLSQHGDIAYFAYMHGFTAWIP